MGWPAGVLFHAGGDVSLTFHVRRMGQAEATKRLRAQRAVQVSVAPARAERGALSDPATELELASASDVQEAVVAGHEALFSVSATLLLRAPSAPALDALEARVREKLGALGVTLYGARWQHAAGFRTAGVPYATDRLGRVRTLDTTSLAFSFPYPFSDVGTAGGPLWGYAHGDRRPVIVDLWDTAAGFPAANLVIVGPAGGGKTVTAGHLAMEHLTQPDAPDIILIDPAKGDYRRMVRELGGQIVRMSTRPEVTLNPFDLPPAVYQSGTGEAAGQNPVMEQARLCTGLAALMVCDEGQRMTKHERAVTESAILAAYGAKGVDPERPETWTGDPAGVPVLPDVLAELERQAKDEASSTARGLAERLRPFCTGTLAGLFSKPTTLRLDAGLTSFDLEGLDSELRPLAVWLIGNHVWKVAKSDRHRRILCLDEVKTLLEHPESARLVAHLYSLGRAYKLSVWSMTQLLSDYSATGEGERALQNAHTALLLRQAAGKGAADAQARYSLTDSDRAYLGPTWSPAGGGTACW